MLTIIAFAITVLGSANWLSIGLLQYDFIAGIFGYQASIFSRIIYIVFGVACAFLIFKMFKGKGTIAVFSRRNKEDLAKNIEKLGKSKKEKEAIETRYAHADIESASEFSAYDHDAYSADLHKHMSPSFESRRSSPPQSMFDEHFEREDDNV